LCFFLVFSVLSNLGFWFHRLTLNEIFFQIGLLCMYGWMVNPLPLLFSAFGFAHYLSERKNSEVRIAVGRSWLLFPVMMVVSAVVWLVSIILMVEFTGGV